MEIRHFRESDVADIVALWNRRVAGCYAAGPLTADVFTASVMGKKHFDPDGLCLAFDRGGLVAFAHAGFRSKDCVAPDLTLGTVDMVAVEDMEGGVAALREVVRYLFRKGVRQVDAFTIDFPNMPFYNGLYGGEPAGMDEDHPCGLDVMRACHFKVFNGAIIMMCDLPDGIAPMQPVEGLELRVGPMDWGARGKPLADRYGIPEPIYRASLMDSQGQEKAGITYWHLDRYNRASGDHLAVVSYVWAAQDLRGTGAAMALQQEVHRILRSQGATRMGLGTGGASGRAVGFYRKLGYRPIKTAYSFNLDWRHHGDYR